MQQTTPTLHKNYLSAEQFREQGEFARAEQLYRQIIGENPEFDPAYHGLGLLANSVGKSALARELLEQAIAINPQVALYHSNLCEMSRRAGKLDEAINAGRQATALQPDNPDFLYNLALSFADKQDYDSAIDYYKKLLRIKPDHGFACNNLGAALERSGKIDEALTFYQKAVELNPGHAEAQNNLGAIHSERGQLDEAKRCFAAAIKARPDFIEPYYNLSTLKTFTLSDPDLLGLKKLMKRSADFTVDEQVRYFFALGKAFEDVAEYEDAFNAYQRGNQLKFSQLQYNDGQADTILRRIKSEFTRELMAERSGTDNEDQTPVFIVGMPRSGTSLLEQILASHGNVYGAGELKILDEVIHRHRKKIRQGESTQDFKQGLGDFDFQSMANGYLGSLRAFNADARHITDKMPANYFYLGFIHLMFPNARIIHAMREPMDSCFSCYAKLFNETMDFAYNLQTLGHYYGRYKTLMQHWHDVLPEGRILDVHYENMVEDIETQTRRMLDYLGLPWDDNCLKFYKNNRVVKTASIAQVRRPIYSSSIARWRHFEKDLQPLMDIVKDHR